MKPTADFNLRERIVDELSQVPYRESRAMAFWVALPLAGMFWRLSYVLLSYGDGVTCSNRRDGQYIALPIPCGELYKAWGEPDAKKRSRVFPSPLSA